MSEHEFEAYLNLLARTLRLSEAQRARIAGELRDHLEARMTELIEEEHLSKEEAVLAALDEFGDANVLAHDLTGPATQLRRKRIMQTGFSVIATAAVVAIAATYLTPTNFQGNPTQTVATAANAGGGADDATEVSAAAIAPHGPLDQTITLDFDGTSLEEALGYFRQTTETNFLIDWAGLEEVGLERDYLISMHLEDVPASTGLKLLMATVSRGEATYRIDDQIVVVSSSEFLSTPEEEMTTKLYECNGLLEDATLLARPGENTSHTDALVDLFRDMLGPEALKTPGSSIAYFGGVVVVRQTVSRQQQISDTITKIKSQLADLADARREELATTPQASGYGDDPYGGYGAH